MNPDPRFLAVVPAAGVGARVGAALPKQYLALAGRTVLEWSLRPLLQAQWIERVIVVVAPGDRRAPAICEPLSVQSGERLRVVPVGGATRRDSVLAGIGSIDPRPGDDDWILVHDAARPGLGAAFLQRLRDALRDEPVGGLLALPVADTVKRGGAGQRVAQTLPREGLWLAQTPQVFRHGLLVRALREHAEVTDEAGAVEAAGHAPLLVEGERRNFKVTTAEDLALMAAVLAGEEHRR